MKLTWLGALSALLLLGLGVPAFAQGTTTINALPTATTPLNCGEVVASWQSKTVKIPVAALGAICQANASPSPPVTGQYWFNTTTTSWVLSQYDGTQWVAIGTLNTVAHTWTPVGGGGASFANPTATIGATAVNGSSTNAMRADAAPPLPSTLPALNGSNLTNLTLANIPALGTGVATALAITHDTTGGICSTGGAGCAPAGTGAVVTTSQSPSSTDWAAYKGFVANNSGLTVTIPLSTTPLSTGGGIIVVSPTNAFGITPNSSDTLNGGSAGVGVTGCNFFSIIMSDASGHDFAPCLGTAASKNTGVTTLTISTATFTPTGVTVNYKIALIHASCPCTLANPSAGFVAGDSGVIEVDQSSTGSDTLGTFGSNYLNSGSITLSTGASDRDFIPYFVANDNKIILNLAVANAH